MTDQSNSPKPFLLNGWLGILVLIALSTYVLESPLKFGLSKIGLSFAIYGRDAIAAATVFLAFMHWVLGKGYSASNKVAFILAIHAFYGIVALESLVQPILGYKLYMFILLGIACYETFQANIHIATRWFIAVYVISIAGVAINWGVDMPWTGSTFDSAAGDTAVSVEWTSGGIPRLSGFARASYDAATIIATTTIPIALLPSLGFLSRAFILLLSTAVIALTTSKGAILAMAFITIYVLFFSKSNKKNGVPALIMAAPAISLTIPLLLSAYQMKAEIGGSLWWLLSSFAVRINWMWPKAFESLSRHIDWIAGRGLGGIGFPQRFSEASIYNSADNIMVYLFVSFGVFAIFYVYWILLKLKENAPSTPNYIWHCLICWLIYLNVYGFTTNLVEGPFFGFFMGIIIGAAMSKPQAAKIHA